MKHFIIPVFIPHFGCPHQCVFCSQTTITGCQRPPNASDVTAVIQAGLNRLTLPRHVEIAYYGGSFTALPLALQAELLRPAYTALQTGQVHSVRLSTRPDSISPAVINLLQQYGVTTVELGVQSFDDNVLKQSERGHSAADSVQALKALRAAGFHTVAQLMIGLPGETWDSLLTTASILVSEVPDAIRIYPTLVLEATELALLYKRGQYRPLSLKEATVKAAFLKQTAQAAGIQVIRTGLQATEDLNTNTILAGPYHPSFGEMVDSELFYTMVSRFFEAIPISSRKAIIHHHPRDHSKLRGLANTNLQRWRTEFGLTVTCIPDGFSLGEIAIEYAEQRFLINSSNLFDV